MPKNHSRVNLETKSVGKATRRGRIRSTSKTVKVVCPNIYGSRRKVGKERKLLNISGKEIVRESATLPSRYIKQTAWIVRKLSCFSTILTFSGDKSFPLK
jgi:hypothetical protein